MWKASTARRPKLRMCGMCANLKVTPLFPCDYRGTFRDPVISEERVVLARLDRDSSAPGTQNTQVSKSFQPSPTTITLRLPRPSIPLASNDYLNLV